VLGMTNWWATSIGYDQLVGNKHWAWPLVGR